MAGIHVAAKLMSLTSSTSSPSLQANIMQYLRISCNDPAFVTEIRLFIGTTVHVVGFFHDVTHWHHTAIAPHDADLKVFMKNELNATHIVRINYCGKWYGFRGGCVFGWTPV